jgi:Phage stabilisation protein
MRKLTPGLQYSEGRSLVWSGAKLINAYAENSDGDKADQFAVIGIPGLIRFSDVSSFPVRGQHVMDGVLYAVIGTTLYSIAEDGTETPLGTIGGCLPVMMADNGTQLAIQGGALNNQGYILDGGVLYTNIVNLPPVSNVVYVDGYFIWTIAESDQFIISALGDGLSYDPLDIATVEGDPDDIIGCIVLQREIQFYGSKTIEFWVDTGNADFPFERSQNAFIERGCRDRNSLIKIDNSVQFMGDDLIVYRLNGYQPVRISTHAIEFKIAPASWFRAFTYTQEGTKFYVLNTDVGTWAYEMSTGAWAERRSLDKVNYRVANAVVAYNRTIMGDAYRGRLYIPSLDVFSEDGETIPIEIVLPGIQTDRMKSTCYSLEIYCESGVGNADDPDPQIIMSYSVNGGRTFSNELSRSMGRVGEYLTRCIWRCGIQFRQLQFKLKMPSFTKRYVIAAFANIDNR